MDSNGTQKTVTVYNKNSEWKDPIMIKHIMCLTIFIIVAWITCYIVAFCAIRQTGMVIPTYLVVFRSINRILHLPFFWLPYNWYRVPNVIGGPGVYRKWYLILVAIFWGCFVYVLFPSIRKITTKYCKSRLLSHRN